MRLSILWRIMEIKEGAGNTLREGEGVFDIDMKIGSNLKSPWVCRYEWSITDFSKFSYQYKKEGWTSE